MYVQYTQIMIITGNLAGTQILMYLLHHTVVGRGQVHVVVRVGELEVAHVRRLAVKLHGVL
jgi:hypothetical protein